MKVINKKTGDQVGIFNNENIEETLKELCIKIEDCQLVETQSEKDRKNLKYLEDTGWLMERHRDQLDLGGKTSLSNDEYKQHLKSRQDARDEIIDNNALANYRKYFS